MRPTLYPYVLHHDVETNYQLDPYDDVEICGEEPLQRVGTHLAWVKVS
jgi:hypothetical protein